MPTELILDRTEATPDGVFGRIGKWYTLEEEDLNNARSVSCIPEGTYICKRTIYHKHGYETFEVTGVPNRSRILIHPGNTEEDSQGCILLGLSRGALTVRDEDSGKFVKKLAIASSKVAFKQFMASLAGVDEFILKVRKSYGYRKA